MLPHILTHPLTTTNRQFLTQDALPTYYRMAHLPKNKNQPLTLDCTVHQQATQCPPMTASSSHTTNSQLKQEKPAIMQESNTNHYTQLANSATQDMKHDSQRTTRKSLIPKCKTSSSEEKRHTLSGLWLAPMTPMATKEHNNKIQNEASNVKLLRTKPDLAKYHHLSCWSPVLTTWCNAINAGYFATFPGLTTKFVRKHLPKSITTTKGHMKKAKKNLHSTQSQLTTIQESPEMTVANPPNELATRKNLVTIKTIKCNEPTSVLATDQTGRFPHRPSQGN